MSVDAQTSKFDSSTPDMHKFKSAVREAQPSRYDGAKLKVLIKPVVAFIVLMLEGFLEAFNQEPMMPRDAILSDDCSSRYTNPALTQLLKKFEL